MPLGLNPDRPFGLPEGTVRGLITLMVVGTAMYGFIMLGGIPSGLEVAFGWALGHYFGVRKVAGGH